MLQTNYRHKYNPNEIDKKTFLANFVVRQETFNEIFDDIKRTDFSVPSQHTVIIGQRGQGKTTLLRKLNIEIEEDKQLSSFLIPIQFAEEQYQIRSLCSLWELIAEMLEEYDEKLFGNIVDVMEKYSQDDDYEYDCFDYLEKEIRKHNKKIVLLIDNIDELFGKLKEKETRKLREILLTSSTFKIIGGSTKMFESHYDYSKEFYQFFKIITLKGLNQDETIKFLTVIANDKQKSKIANIIKNQKGKIETLRQLTGGVPRTLVMLFDIFMDDDGSAFDDLVKVIDEATPLYKHRMDDLPPVLQDIVHNIALNWDGMFTKDIAKKTRLESKEVSSQLKQLEKYQIVESVSIGKNKIYKIEERFFNIWYLMRFGRKKDRNRVEWLVRFISTWYTKEELENKCKQLIKATKNNKIKEHYLYHMSEALSYTGQLDIKMEYLLKNTVKEYFEKYQSEYGKEISPSDADIIKKALESEKNGQFNEAIKLLIKSKKSTKEINMLLGYLYSEQKEYEKAEEYYLKAIDAGNNDALFNLGNLYSEQKEYSKAEEYYLKAIDTGNNKALNNLGNLYSKQKEYSKAEEYYKKAIDAGNNDALFNLGNLYSEQKEYSKAEESYKKAIDTGDNDALFNLGNLYSKQKEYSKAEDCYKKAIDAGDNGALINLGILYNEQKEYSKAEDCYKKAIDAGDNDALFNLGNLYSEQKEYLKAEECYKKAIDFGNNKALNALSWMYFELEKEPKEALELIQKSYDTLKDYYNTHTFATILLWNEKFDKSYEKFEEWMEFEVAVESLNDISEYINLLIVKSQYYKAKEYFENEKYQLKDKLKPIWYALMTLMQDEFPNEIKKMGSELQESVNDILKTIEELRQKYKI